MKFKRTFLTIGATVGAVAFGVFALAFGFFAGTVSASAPNQTEVAPDRPRPVRIVGRVEQVGANSLTLTVRGGMTATVRVNDNTWIVVKQNGVCGEGSLSDVQTSSPAMVAGMTTNERGVINARAIAQCRGGLNDNAGAKVRDKIGGQVPGKVRELAKHFGVGTVKSINGGALVVTTERRGDLTVNTTAETLVLNNGFTSVSTLKVGDKVQVFGKPDKSAAAPASGKRAIAAWALRVDNGANKLMVGRVDSVNGNTITLRTREHKDGIQVTFAGNAGFKTLTVADKKASLSNAAQSDVKAGSNLVVDGAMSADGKSYTANAVIILPAGKNK